MRPLGFGVGPLVPVSSTARDQVHGAELKAARRPALGGRVIPADGRS